MPRPTATHGAVVAPACGAVALRGCCALRHVLTVSASTDSQRDEREVRHGICVEMSHTPVAATRADERSPSDEGRWVVRFLSLPSSQVLERWRAETVALWQFAVLDGADSRRWVAVLPTETP